MACSGACSGWNRREFLQTTALTGGAIAFGEVIDPVGAFAADADRTPGGGAERVSVTLRVNGEAHSLDVDARTTLLDALREQLGLTGTKKGCDMGACGACTVHVDGRRVLACLTLAAMVDDRPITTIEGLAQGDRLHPVQVAFVEHDAFQCGYCTPGQIMSAAALIDEGHAHSDASIREFMSGNICRCGAYPNIVAAIKAASAGGRA